MGTTQRLLSQSSDLQEVVSVIAGIYCPHEMQLPKYRGLAATLEVLPGGYQPIVKLTYSTPAQIDAGNFPNLMLFQTCIDGTGTIIQEGARAAHYRHQTLPLSPGLGTKLEFGAQYAQRSVRVNLERAELLCSRLIRSPLDGPLRFDLCLFSAELERMWAEAVSLVYAYERMSIALPAAAAIAFDEFMLSLVLTRHPHSYSEYISRKPRTAAPRVVREAERLMQLEGSEQTVSSIAARVGVSLRSLEAGFREWRQSTPTQSLRRTRLTRARAELLAPFESTSVTAVALENGFVHLGRFSAYYRAAFGESPGQTLRRSRLKK
jgi:AraC-like DNA-binding protein